MVQDSSPWALSRTINAAAGAAAEIVGSPRRPAKSGATFQLHQTSSLSCAWIDFSWKAKLRKG